jgi:GNAT superfamily N-acetyltransferase
LEEKRERIDPSICKTLEKGYIEKMKRELTDGSCKAWVIEDGNKIVASGAVSIVSFVPTPKDLFFKVAYLHSMYTEKAYRNRQCAQRIIKIALQYCKNNGLKRIILNASDAGRPKYEKLGFQTSPDTMRLLLK